MCTIMRRTLYKSAFGPSCDTRYAVECEPELHERRKTKCYQSHQERGTEVCFVTLCVYADPRLKKHLLTRLEK